MTSTVSSATGNTATAIYDAINASSSSVGKTASKSATSATQDQFLKLLTTQLQNQDPLNPMDNAQITSQLAQISTVDGIAQLNATLQTLLNNSTQSQTLQAASLVGKSVLVPGGSLALSQGQGVAGVDLAGPADSVVATIKDANGLTVRTLNLGAMSAGINTFAWDGKSDSGAAAADGSYSVSLAATQGGNAVTATALEVDLVTSVAQTGSTVSLNLGSKGTVTLADVKQII